jgi:hypothetical protein
MLLAAGMEAQGIMTIISSISAGGTITVTSAGTLTVAGVSIATAGVAVGAATTAAGTAAMALASGNFSDDYGRMTSIGKSSGGSNGNSFKSIGSNNRANEIAKQFGYEGNSSMGPAEQLKADFVGDTNVSKFKMMQNTSTKEIVLENINNGAHVYTGLILR